MIYILQIALFVGAVVSSLHFVSRTIEHDQDPAQVKLSRYVFSVTFGLCILMLSMFLGEVWQSDQSQTAWRFVFVVTTIDLLLVIPGALVRDFCFAKHLQLKRKKTIAISFCACILVFFVINALIMDAYIEHDLTSEGLMQILFASVGLMATALSAQMEFLTLTGIVFNALMQGYVCSNSIYCYLIENLELIVQDHQSTLQGHRSDIESGDGSFEDKDFHRARIEGVLSRIAEHRKRQKVIEIKLQTHFDSAKETQPQPKGFFSWFKSNSDRVDGTLTQRDIDQLTAEMDDCAKQIRMLTILQKEYVMDEADYTKTSKLLQQRQTKCGRLQYNIGKAIAVYYLCKFLIATKQIIYPVYSSQVLDSQTRFVLLYFGLHQHEEDESSLTVKVQYFGLIFTGCLIVSNVQSLLRKLLVTMKYILRDNDIQFSFQTTILSLSFVMGSYYLSLLLQMSMNLPEERRQPFQALLDKFTTEVVLYTFDCFFVMGVISSTLIIAFTRFVKRGRI